MRFLNLVRCLFVQFQCKSSYFLPKVNSTINENGNKNSCKRLRFSWGFIVTIQFRPSCNQTKNPEIIPGIFCIGMEEVV